MTITLNGTTGITTPAVTNNGAYTGDGISFADATPSNTLVTTTGGYVGVGTSSPAAPLQVKVATNANFAVDNNSGVARLDFFNDAASSNVDACIQSTSLVFYGNSGAERMRIDSSGNLLVGTTSTAPRDFTSGGGAALQPSAAYEFATANSTISFMNYTGSASGAGTFIAFRQQGAARGSISTNGSTTAYNTSSDYRLKENIAPMTGALAVVGQLKPCTYTWKESGIDSQGFIAHELQAVVPDCVTGEKDAVDADGNPVYQGIDTSFLVATLTAAIQEQQAIITDLKARIETLENK